MKLFSQILEELSDREERLFSKLNNPLKILKYAMSTGERLPGNLEKIIMEDDPQNIYFMLNMLLRVGGKKQNIY